MAGCLAKIRCGIICPNNIGSMKELDDFFFGGTVSQADALSTDDGWDAARQHEMLYKRAYFGEFGPPLDLDEGIPPMWPGGDVEFCRKAFQRSVWVKFPTEEIRRAKKRKRAKTHGAAKRP
jgi:hypothetical protein